MTHRGLLLGIASVFAVFAQNADPFDSRLPTTTIVREDLFAGPLANDMERFARGERTLDELLATRPKDKARILAWKGGAALFRAALAHEQNQPNEFAARYKQANGFFDEAAALAPEDLAVAAITGGSIAGWGERIPKEFRAEGYARGYRAYQMLWQRQGATVEQMPLHLKGELFAGLAMMAQRTGRTEETTQHLDRMITVLANSPYEARARKWKENPELAGRTILVCVTCHDAGKLDARRAALSTPATPAR